MAQSGDKDSGFSTWLSKKLNLLKIDENIYLNYILSILEGEETRDEKLEILQSILVDTESSEEVIINHCNDILDKWQIEVTSKASKENTSIKEIENVDQKLARLLESNVQLGETTQTCNYTDEDLKIREAILSQYAHADDLDDDYEVEDKDDMADLEKNTNVTAIHQAEKEKREKAKLENQKKKERDKQEREKQKLTQQEKKEARRKRAQKVEHHRK